MAAPRVALADLVRNQDMFGLGAFATTKRFTGEEGHPMIGRGNLSTVEIGRIMAAHLKPMTEVKRIADDLAGLRVRQAFHRRFLGRDEGRRAPISSWFARNGRSSAPPTLPRR